MVAEPSPRGQGGRGRSPALRPCGSGSVLCGHHKEEMRSGNDCLFAHGQDLGSSFHTFGSTVHWVRECVLDPKD